VDGRYSIKDLIDIESLSKILEKFSLATGFTTGFVSFPDQEVLLATGWRDVCTKFHRNFPESKEYCRQSNFYLTERLKESKEFNMHCCKNGLIDGATPVIIAGEHVASLFTGQVLFEEPDIKKFKERALTHGYDIDDYLEALSKVPIVNKDVFQNALSFLGEMAVLIAELGLKNYELEEKASLLRDEIFDRERAESVLRESEEKYRKLVESSVDGIAIVQRTEFKFANQAFLDMFGASGAEEVIGHNFTELVSREHRDLVMQRGLDREQGKDVPNRYEFRALRQNGTEFDVEISVGPISHEGDPAWQAILRDITQRKQAEEALRESEERFRAVLEAVPDLMIVLDAEGNYREIFTADSDLLYAPAEEVRNKSIHDILPQEDAQQIQEIIDRVFATGELQYYEYQLETGGIERWFAGRATKFNFQNADCVLWCARDITQRKKAEEGLRESEERHRMLLEASPDPIAVYDMEGKATYVNPAFIETFGWPSQELLGKRIDFVPEESWPETRVAIARMLRGERIQSFETRRLTKDGRLLDVQLSSSVFHDRDGYPAGNVVILRDVSDRKRAEDGLRKREAELAAQSRHLEEVNAALNVLLKRREEDKADLEERFLANVKELMVPYLERLKNSRLESNQMTLVGILESNLKEIISPFVTKLSSRFLGLTPTEIQVASLIRDGRSSKEIAALLNTSENTVRSHRFHIRSKLGIKHKKVNMMSYLKSLHND